jgi:hypothetical protein
MKKVLCISLVMLSGCGVKVAPVAPLVLIDKNQPNIRAPVEAPPDPQLVPFVYDVPRDMNKEVVKNLSYCLDVPASKQTTSFWQECGTHPPQIGSNIFIGFDQANWNIFRQDWAKLKAREVMWQARLDQINKERQETNDQALSNSSGLVAK